MAKRRLVSLLPGFSQTDDLKNFFGGTVDEVFQPGTPEQIAGYIGRRPVTADPQDVYIGEPTASRFAYQLESGMVSVDADNNLSDVLVYPDFIAYMQSSGANISDEQRLTETDYYCWAPPINIDTLVNYPQYYWFGDATGITELPILCLTIPLTKAAGDGQNIFFDLPPSILSVAPDTESPTVYVNNVPVTFNVLPGNQVALSSPPPTGSSVLIARVPDFAAAITDQISVNISDINKHQVERLSSGMRIKIIDALYYVGSWDAQPWDYSPWDAAGKGVYMVDGVGSSMRLTEDESLIRNIKPQYVTIDRSSLDHNLWSLHNLWVHKDTFAWANVEFPTRQAVRPIIEFVRDIVLWHVDIQLTTSAAAGTAVLAAQPMAGLLGSEAVGPSFAADTVVTDVTGTIITLSKPIIAPIDHATTIRFQQVWQESIDPLFMLYDLYNVPLNDLNRYPGSTFNGSTILSYSVGSTPIDPVLLRSVTVDQNGYYVFDNKPVTERYIYDTGAIDGLYTYAVDAGTLIVEALWHPVRWTTSQGQTNGFYDVPMNLEANPLWDDVTTISRSTWNPHFASMIANQLEFSGQALGDNNYRDTSRDLTVGIGILQHRAPLLKAMLLASNRTGQSTGFDLPQAIRYAEQEYNRFRNKFARKLVDLYNTGVLPTDLVSDVILVLNEIKRDKTNQFPFALNTIAGGQYFIPPTPTCLGVLPAAVPAMIIDNTYTTPILMCFGHDGSRTPAFGFFVTLSENVVSGSVVLPVTSINDASIGQIISGDWIAAGTMIVNLTATSLTIDTPTTANLNSGANILINDWRDPIMLELEQMIYDHLPVEFKTEARPGFDIQQWMDGAFFTPYNGYTRPEINDMLLSLFELWVMQNGLDYRSHINFDPYNPFTWNFRDIPDRSGTPMPGNWRAIYRWYYGTEAPHQRPWEMLGFIYEPSWWQGVYGAAPYTRNNTALWLDLELGLIRDGPRAGVDDAYARTGLSTVIPVDAIGNLLDPVAASIIVATVTPDLAGRDWMMGDQGPVESMWLNTPSYRFALATLGFWMKPARMVEQCWNRLTIGYLNNQWVDLTTSSRPLHAEQYVHGESHNGITLQVIGISQWIADHLLATGQPSSLLGTAIRGLDVRLIHRMAGFISRDTMMVVADNFGLLPAENIATVLYTSPIILTDVYSGVIMEWTGHSWRAIGYDAHDPAFTIIPPDLNGPKGVISIATTVEPVILPWHPNSYYATGVFTVCYNTVWQCIRSHTSSPQFEQNFWQSRPDMTPNMARAPRVITYTRGTNTVQRVPYGTEFTTLQQVGDFLLGWERWLETQGWVFSDTVPETAELRNWSLSVKEFLSWTQVRWAPGNFIALSPGQQHLEYTAASGTILNVENDTTGFFGLIDRSGRPITQRDAVVNRRDGDIAIHAKSADIFAARLSLVNIEHALVFSNLTIFDDVIYLPLFRIRQLRLRLNGVRAPDWTGRMDAPGFVITGNTIAADFETAAEDVRLMFDIEPPVQGNLRDYARHVVGFQRRDYLENLFLSDIEQFEFWQGMISQKGAPGVFSKLVRSNRASDNSNLQFLEEWAVRVDEFGAPVDPFMIFQLRQTETRNDPQIVRLIPTVGAPLDWIVLAPVDDRWLDQPADPAAFFSMRDTGPVLFDTGALLPSAGPVRLSDVTYTAFALSNVPDMYMTMLSAGTVPFSTGSTTWVYERADGTYTVLHSFETGRGPNSILKVITNAENATINPITTRLIFQQPITLTPADVGNYLVVDGLSLAVPEFQGLVMITAIDVLAKTVDVEIAGTTGHDFTDDTTSAPIVRVLREVRFDTYDHLVQANYAFAAGDLAWIDAGANNDLLGSYVLGTLPLGLIASWRVLQWTGTAWITLRQQPPRTDPTTIAETAIYYAGMKIVTTTTNPQMIIDEPVVDDVIVIDPLAGLIAGVADRDIDFKVAYDPARYNAGVSYAANPWGVNELGRVWWNLATVKFLDPFTDTLGETAERDIAELQYRTANWAHIAPGTSVDVYEWTASTNDPTMYTGPGTVFNHDSPSWVVQTTYDPLLGRDTTQYFFWVSGLTETPFVAFRHNSVSTIALAIANPSALDLAWMAPIHQDTLIVSGVSQFLNDATTVMKIRLTMQSNNPGRHDEWRLMRPTDKTSLPSTTLWQKLRDSLAGFDYLTQPIPAPSLNVMRATGIRSPQNMFAVADGGLLAARQSFVGMINTIFLSVPIRSDRGGSIATLYRSEAIDTYLIWLQKDDSYIIKPPPYNEWEVQVFSVDERNYLLTRPDFIDAAHNGTNIRVLLNNMAGVTPQWSIWQFNAVIAQQLIAANFPGTIDQVLFKNAASIFTLATAYDVIVADRTARDKLVGTLLEGTRVFVTRDVANFWAIWNYLPSDGTADAAGFVLWRVQSYQTDDFIAMADWYAPGFQANNPPIITYASLTERNITEAAKPINHFVKVNDDGTSEQRWIWTKYEIDQDTPSASGTWRTVAIQNGTLKLSDAFYRDSTVPYDVNVATLMTRPALAGDYAITVSKTNGFNAGQFVMIPGIAHSTKITGVYGTLVNLDMPLAMDLAIGTTVTVTRMDLSDIPNRDGSWEIFVLADALRYGGLLLESEINSLFFSMLNFVHVQQYSVDWAFKTSFMTIIGYDVPLHQTPVLLADQTPNLVSYINEVKPYHCKIRDFSTQYNTDLDIGTINGPGVEAEASYFTVGLLFDRYAPGDGWDVNAWQLYPWDAGDSEPNRVAVHTNILALAGNNTVQVEDVGALKDYLPFDITIGSNVYHIIAVSIDPINANMNDDVSVIPPLPISGTLTADRGAIEGNVGDEVEAILAVPNAVRRTFLYYPPIGDLTTEQLASLFGSDMRSVANTYTVAANALSGDTSVRLNTTTSIVVGQPVFGPIVAGQPIAASNIAQGTMVLAVTTNLITLNRPLMRKLTAGEQIGVGLPVKLSGGSLQAASSQFDMVLNADVAQGSLVLRFARTVGAAIGQTVVGTGIATGTLIVNVSATTITLNAPTTAPLVVGMTVTMNALPEIVYDGNALHLKTPVDVTINPPLTSRPGGFDLRAPYHEAGHPEERIPFDVDDALHMTVTAQPVAGAPPQIVKVFNVSPLTDNNVTLFYDMIAQSAAAVMVFRDGVRATLNTDYTVDHFARTATVNLYSGLQRIIIHAFGYGGPSAVIDTYFPSFQGNPITIAPSVALPPDWHIDPNAVAVTVNGAPTMNFTIQDNLLTLTPPPSVGTDVAIVVYDGWASTSSSQISVQTFVVTGATTWQLTPHDTDTKPAVAGTIVEANGLRLTPTTDYTVNNRGVLTVTKALNFQDTVVATLFTHATGMGIQTATFILGTADTSTHAFNFRTGTLDPQINFTRASTATYFDATGTMQSVANNVPRFDCDPTSGINLGLLLEEARTNSIRNPRAEGAVVGSPGTLPTNWTIGGGLAGLTSTVIGTGTESGIPYIDIRFNGTTTGAGGTTVNFENNHQIAALTGQTWSLSAFLRLISGSFTNITSSILVMQEYTSGGSVTAAETQIVTPTATNLNGQRFSFNTTLSGGATTAFVQPYFKINYGTGAVIDVTIRIGAPQAEAGVCQTSTILPVGAPAAATRAVDVASVSLSTAWWYHSGGDFSVAIDYDSHRPVMTNAGAALGMSVSNAFAGSLYVEVPYTVFGAPGPGLVSNGVYNVGANITAFSVSSSQIILSSNGTAATVNNTGAVYAFNTMYIGGNWAGGGTLNGHVARFRIWNHALSAADVTQNSTAVASQPFIVPCPIAQNYSLVSMNGLTLLEGVDYTITPSTITTATLTILQPTSGTIVATVFTTPIARDLQQWMVNSRLPATVRMPLLPPQDELVLTGTPLGQVILGTTLLVSAHLGHATNKPLGQMMLGVSPLGSSFVYPEFDVLDEYCAQSAYMAGTLTVAVANDSHAIVIDAFLRDVSPKLRPDQPFTIPTSTTPGSVWIDSERIEYFGYSRTNDVVTLTQLRRATRGTSLVPHSIDAIVSNGDLIIEPPEQAAARAAGYSTYMTLGGLVATTAIGTLTQTVSGQMLQGLAATGLTNNPQDWSIAGAPAKGAVGSLKLAGGLYTKQVTGVHANGMSGKPTSHVT